MRRTKVRDRAHPEHPLVQCQGLACQRPAPPRQRRQAFPERRVEPLDVRRIDDPVALRAPSERLDAYRRAIDHAACRVDDATTLVATPWAIRMLRQGRNRGRPPLPVCTGSRKVSRMARMEDTKPSVQSPRG